MPSSQRDTRSRIHNSATRGFSTFNLHSETNCYRCGTAIRACYCRDTTTATSFAFVAIARLGAPKATAAAILLEDLLGCSAILHRPSQIQPLYRQTLILGTQRRYSISGTTPFVTTTCPVAKKSQILERRKWGSSRFGFKIGSLPLLNHVQGSRVPELPRILLKPHLRSPAANVGKVARSPGRHTSAVCHQHSRSGRFASCTVDP